MRVNPILQWEFGHVWHFLRSFHLEYCSLYDQVDRVFYLCWCRAHNCMVLLFTDWMLELALMLSYVTGLYLAWEEKPVDA